jgi:poly(A) polymerase
MLKRIRALLGRRGNKATGETQTASERNERRGRVPSRPGEGSARPPVRHGPKVVHWPIAAADLDPDAVKIVRRLARFDHRAYLVGGCVRDLLLDRRPKDFDVGTSATPRQIKRLFRNCRIIGRRFRLAHIYFQNGKIIEVATFRARDVQEPSDVEPDKQDLLIRADNIFGTPEEDALRRDFTINSLFYDLGDETVLDHADGLGDLRRKLVRTIGDPDIRFREDPVRILRAIKFAARLDFRIEKKTLASLGRTRDELHKAATSRVLEELNRFCRAGAAKRSFELLDETGVFEVVFPEIAKDYARDARARSLMFDLLGRMDDERANSQREIRTGEIFVAVLLPLISSRFGWKADGTATRPSGLNVRHTIDEVLRPLAVRLRIPRREQEHCRQVLATLWRMVPARRVRRNTKRAILRRECLPDALWVLRVLADRLGEDFVAAHAYWTAGLEAQPEARGAETGGPRARRGRRRSRRKPRTDRAKAPGDARRRADAPPDEAKETKETKKGTMPPPWDDDYFFAALPSAPEIGGDDSKGDRYGAGAVAPPDASDGGQEAAKTDAAPAARPKRKRRPRRRRRRPATSRSADADEPAGSEEAAKTTDPQRRSTSE